MRARLIATILMATGALGACDRIGEPETPAGPATPTEPYAEPPLEAPPVDAALLAAPNADFVAVEPSEIGVIAAPSVTDALAPLLSVEAVGEGENVQASVRDVEGGKVADVVRSGMADDSVGAAHVRIEFRQEPDGWYPTNAFRRAQCRRGADPAAWSVSPCP